MKFENKISGTAITDFSIKPLFTEQFVSLKDAMEKIHTQKAMDFLLDTFRFQLTVRGEWIAILDFDSIYKITILESYPGYEDELTAHFGDNWLNQYLRFGH